MVLSPASASAGVFTVISPTLLPLSAGFTIESFGKSSKSVSAEGLSSAENSIARAVGSPANLSTAFAAGFTMQTRLDSGPQPA